MPGSERCPATHSVETSTSGCAYATASSNQVKPDKDRKSTRLNSSHSQISYAVFCLKKKKKNNPLIGFSDICGSDCSTRSTRPLRQDHRIPSECRDQLTTLKRCRLSSHLRHCVSITY